MINISVLGEQKILKKIFKIERKFLISTIQHFVNSNSLIYINNNKYNFFVYLNLKDIFKYFICKFFCQFFLYYIIAFLCPKTIQ